MLLGTAWGQTVTSTNNIKETYNPALYYENFLKKTLKIQ